MSNPLRPDRLPSRPRRRRWRRSAVTAIAVMAVVSGVWALRRAFEVPPVEAVARDRLVAHADRLATDAGEVLRYHPSTAREQLARDRPEVFDSRVRADGVVEWDAVLTDRAGRGGGLFYEATALRTCVRLSGRPGPSPSIHRTDLPCPASVDDLRRFGPYQKTVSLPDAEVPTPPAQSPRWPHGGPAGLLFSPLRPPAS